MGSTISEIDCPRCKNIAIEDYYYKTGEFAISCKNCGYGKSKFIRRNDAGDIVLKDPLKPIQSDNLIWDEEELADPWGCFQIVYADGITQVGSVQDEDHYIDFGQFAKSDEAHQDNVCIISVNRLNEDGEIETTVLYENPDAKPREKPNRQYPSNLPF
jgi:hypothetical protein